MYIDEDIDNLYLALDLCSDQTNNESGEWVGVWLNTNNTAISNSDEWAAEVNQGMESLIYDVDNDQLIPFFDPGGFWDFVSYYIEQNSDFDVFNGTLSGDVSDLLSIDNQFLNITSEYLTTFRGWILRLISFHFSAAFQNSILPRYFRSAFIVNLKTM
jgi:hypothetical protein